MSKLLTAVELAAVLRMNSQVLLRHYRAGKIKAEFLIGRSPRFDQKNVRKQLSEAMTERERKRFTGMVPTL